MRSLNRLPVFALVLSAALPLCAQQSMQYWPPDDDPTGPVSSGPASSGSVQPEPIPSYSPAGQQYGSGQYGAGQYNSGQYNPGQQYSQNYPQQQAYADIPAQQQYNAQPTEQPLSADQLAQLIAPVALYPDALIAQILAASTYPAQIAAADQWLQSMGNAAPEQIAAAADTQSNWDPSVKALTAFPQVLSMLDRNLQWTTALGNAYYNQPQDVLQTIQVMRQRAEGAGNLQSTPQADVEQNQGYIDIAPANPQVVYVPTYNPWAVYGAPVNPYPGFSWLGAVGQVGSFFGSSPVQYGLSFAMSAFLGTPWGWLGWGLDWFAHSVLFNHNDYCTASYSVRDWGFPNGGPRAWARYPHPIHGGGNYGWGHNGGYGNNRYQSAGNSFNRGNYPHPTGGPVNRPVERLHDARTQEGFNRGFPSRNQIYGRPSAPTQQAFAARPQQFGGQQFQHEQFNSRGQFNGQHFNSGASAFPRDNHISRPGMAFSGSTSQNYRAPQHSVPRSPLGNNDRDYSGSDGYGGSNAFRGGNQTWSQPQQRSGGFHLFGGGHNNSGSFGGGRAPQSYSYNGGGHSGWGNPGGGWKAPRAPHENFGGGGHSSFSGGHSSGGSHSSGGGHSSGGSHHR
ncbi:MAG: DUF3300 domain-containing protein [Terracidiphilus sp.]